MAGPVASVILLGSLALADWSANVKLPVFDWVLYWSAGRLALAGENPYDPDNLSPFQERENPATDSPANVIRFYNPPWSLPLFMLFGLIGDFTLFRLAWALMLLVVLILCAEWCWRSYGGPASKHWVAWIIAFAFVPVLNVVQSGQMAPVVLLGVVGFMAMQERGRPWLAGAALLLAAGKPHLLTCLWTAIPLWAADRRQWKVVAGGVIAGIAATGLVLMRDPAVIWQYGEALRSSDPSREFITPTLGSLLRLAYARFGSGSDLSVLQYLPTIVGLIVTPVYYLSLRKRWDWREQTPILLFASILAAPYGAWLADMTLLMLPVLQATVWLANGRLQAWKIVVLTAYVLTSVVALWANVRPGSTYWFVWVAPVLFGIYLFARREQTRSLGH